ncbi:hypothetical protein C0Q70_20447 [Pomacea canaliculata]|uniref:Uncharacterized protein n=1 Tax=Pomacea canaliculata TaxID=400727 RepID=A0A2T7NFJ9_POMCA|nr:hypothetical protein C0Q70_20447 [Pomacea canaliculata]
MDVFFYDYDDFDHTTALVDWFETELVGEDAGSEGQQQVIVNGNRQSDKTRMMLFLLEGLSTIGVPVGSSLLWCKGLPAPPPEWKLWPWEDTNPKQDPLETGHISNNRGQRVYYQKEYRQGRNIKSPFKPFSTAKHSPEKKGSKGSDSPITPQNVVRHVVELPSTMTPAGPTSGEREDQIRQNVDIRSQNFSTRAQNGRAQTQAIPRSPFVQRWRGYQHETPSVRSWDTDRGVSETVLQGRPQDFQETDMVETRASATPQAVRSLPLRPTMSPPKSLMENIRERNRWLSRKGGKGNDSLIDEEFIPSYYKKHSLKDKKFIPTLSGNPEGRGTTLSQVGGVNTTPEPVLKVENERKNDLNNKDGREGILNSTSASMTVTSLHNYTVSNATGTVQYSPTKNDGFTRSEESDLVHQEPTASRLIQVTRNATATSATTTAASTTVTTVEKSRNVTLSKLENSFIQEGASPSVTVGYTSPQVTVKPTSSQAAVMPTSSPVTVVSTSSQVTVQPTSPPVTVVPTSSPVTVDYRSPQVTVMPTSSQAAVVSTSSPVTVVSTSSKVTVVPTSSPFIAMSSLREKTRTASAISNEYVTYLQGDVTPHLSSASHSSTAGSASALTLEPASSMLSPTPRSLREQRTSPAIVYTRPRGWGPNEKNLFVTWIPNTPAAGWIPSENRASGGTLDEYIDEALMRRNVPHSPIELRVRGQSSDAILPPRDKGAASSRQESSPAVDKVKQWLDVVHQLQEHSNQEEKDRKIAEAGGVGCLDS